MTKRQLTTTDLTAHVPPRIQRRFVHSIRSKTHTFFDLNGKVYGVDQGRIYHVKSPFTGTQLCGFNLRVFKSDGHYIQGISPLMEGEIHLPDLTSPQAFKVNSHAIDRIRERNPLFRNRSDESLEKYILNAVTEAASKNLLFKTEKDEATFYLHGQFAFVVRHGHVRTSIRRCKLHDLALTIAQQTNKPVPDALVSKQTKAFLFGSN